MDIDANIEQGLETSMALITAEMGDVAVLDLHGMPARMVPQAVEEFLQSRWMQGDRSVRIVHGKGEGAVRREVQTMLRTHELVQDFRLHENGGSTAVAFVPRYE